jgi:hypothetical protein
MWDAINIANDHEIISLDMIMVDREVIIYLFLKYIYIYIYNFMDIYLFVWIIFRREHYYMQV